MMFFPLMANPDDLSVYPSDRAFAGLILAHGAGGGQHSHFMALAARALAVRGLAVATFDFPYMAQGRKVPDKGPVLENAWRAAIESARARPEFLGLPLAIGGKSMGGRIASQIAAAGVGGLSSLVLFGYPLHPPGKPAQRRDAHLPSIAQPMLFVQGTRDPLGTAEDIRALLPRLNQQTRLYAVDDGDHSFKVRVKTAGRRQDAVFAEIFDVAAAFIQTASSASVR
jgi:hypothetical protein